MAHAKKKLRWVYRSKPGAVDDLPANCPSPTHYGIVGDRSLRSSYWGVRNSIDDAGPKYGLCTGRCECNHGQVSM